MAFVRRSVSVTLLTRRQIQSLVPKTSITKTLCLLNQESMSVNQIWNYSNPHSVHLRKLSMCCIQPCRSIAHSKLLQPPDGMIDHKRFYAKKKDKGGKGKKGGKRSSLNAEELAEVINYEKMVAQMDEVIENLKQEYIKQLSLRSNLSSFETLIIDTEDGKFPLNQVAQIAQKGASTITINCGAMIQYLPAIKNALEKSGMNINPQMDKNTIFVAIPKVTREHRETLAKAAKTLSDKSKDKLKDIHNKYQRDAKKKSEVSEDLVRNVVETIHDKLHEYQATCDDLMKQKQEELLPK